MAEQLLDLEGVAELYGIHMCTVRQWIKEGLPCAERNDGNPPAQRLTKDDPGASPYGAKDSVIGRRRVAEILGTHVDGVTRQLPNGLACALVEFGGHSRLSLFSLAALSRWRLAAGCRADYGRPCAECRLCLEDAKAVAEHVVQAKHGIGNCTDCAARWALCLPCERWE